MREFCFFLNLKNSIWIHLEGNSKMNPMIHGKIQVGIVLSTIWVTTPLIHEPVTKNADSCPTLAGPCPMREVGQVLWTLVWWQEAKDQREGEIWVFTHRLQSTLSLVPDYANSCNTASNLRAHKKNDYANLTRINRISTWPSRPHWVSGLQVPNATHCPARSWTRIHSQQEYHTPGY